MATLHSAASRAAPRRPADVIASWAQRCVGAARQSAPDNGDADGAPLGPGWFDSSHALAQGLEVHEDFSGEAAMRGWLEAWLRSDRPKRARAPSSRRTPVDAAAAIAFELEPGAGAACVDDAAAAAFAAYDIDGWSLV